LKPLKPYFRRSSGGSSSSCLASARSLSAPPIAQWFRLWLLFHSLFSPQRAAPAACDVRRDPPCLVAGQTDSSPSMAGMALLMPVNRAGAVEYEIDENNGIKA
jgi:hypothetical protein